MWAQDAAAMYTYAGSSAAAMVLTPFTSPRQNTDTGGTAAQAAAAIQATDAPAGNAQSIVSGVAQTFSAVPDAVQSLAAAAPAASSSSTLGTLSDLITIFVGVPTNLASLGVGLPLDLLGAVDLPFSLGGYVVGTHVDDIVSGWNGEQTWPSTDPAPVRGFPATLMKLSPGTLSAGLGQANTVGGLSVPSAWTVAAPELRPAALALPIGSTSPIAAAPMELGSSTSLSQMGLAGMTGRAMAGAPSSGEANDGRKVIGSPVVVRPGGGAADSDGEASHAKPRIVVTGVAAKIRELSKLRDEGDLTDEEYAQLKKHLLGR
jgi:PPE-repeat protein